MRERGFLEGAATATATAATAAVTALGAVAAADTRNSQGRTHGGLPPLDAAHECEREEEHQQTQPHQCLSHPVGSQLYDAIQSHRTRQCPHHSVVR